MSTLYGKEDFLKFPTRESAEKFVINYFIDGASYINLVGHDRVDYWVVHDEFNVGVSNRTIGSRVKDESALDKVWDGMIGGTAGG